jgi:DNA topoisomerase-1
MSPAVIDTTTVEIKAGKYTFRATGSIIKFPGFMKVYTESRDDGQEDEDNRVLPEMLEGDRLEKKSLAPKQHFTQPPPRYTDATLVKALEEKGIGRPSTYAPIVETIQKRGYVVKEKKQFYPTELGVVVVNLLKDYFKDIIDVEFTASMEEKLDEVEEGDLVWSGVLRDFYEPFKITLSKAEKEIGHVEVAQEVTGELCEVCGRNLVVKMGRYGKFLACPGFPQCRFTKPLLEPTGAGCPQCEGELVLRRSKKGRAFYGCSRYPECEFTVWDRPTPEKCPACGGLTVYKKSRGKEEVKCISPECPASGPARGAGKKSPAKKAKESPPPENRGGKKRKPGTKAGSGGAENVEGKIAAGR